MNALRNTLILILTLGVIVVILDLSGVVSVRSILGMGELTTAAAEQNSKEENAAKNASSNWARPDNKGSGMNLQFQDVQQVLSNLEANRRTTLLDDEEGFRKFIVQEQGNLSVLEAARVNQVDQDQNAVFLMQRAADSVLRESYIGKLLAEKFPADFPNDDQIKEFYDKNKDK